MTAMHMPENEKVTFNMSKDKDFSEWFSKIIDVAELADLRNDVKGFIVFRPWAVRCMKQMYRCWEASLEKRGHWPVLFPAVIPERLLKLEGEHVEGFAPQVFWIETAGAGVKLPEKYALRPTSETAMYDMYRTWIRSWRDLPLKLYQSCQVWRYETKATRPFIRSREFWWIEAHDAFATLEEANTQVKEDMEMTEEVMHQQFGIPFIFFQRPEWDKFPGAVDTFAADTLMPDGRVLQLPSTHLLGQRFSKPFNILFKTKDEKEGYVWQTCYGPAISRIIAAVFALHGDNKGLCFPFDIAPLQVVIVPILGKDDKKVLGKAGELKEKLGAEGLRVELDDSEKRPGEKFYFWEMKGVPIRVELGLKEVEQNKLTLFRRDTDTKAQVNEADVLSEIQKIAKSILGNLKKNADRFFSDKIYSASTMEELKKSLDKGGFTKINICSRDMDGKDCADNIKAGSGGGDIRGTRFGAVEKPTGKCIWCGKPAKAVVYVGKSY